MLIAKSIRIMNLALVGGLLRLAIGLKQGKSGSTVERRARAKFGRHNQTGALLFVGFGVHTWTGSVSGPSAAEGGLGPGGVTP
jgi:hypothetical protein